MWSTQVFENQTQENTTELENRLTPIRNNIIKYSSNNKFIYPKKKETVDFEHEPEPEPVFDRPEDKNTIDELPFSVTDDILKEQRLSLMNLDDDITAFNVGVNAGVDAGQSIMHCHIHLIPRRKGDIKNPRGGVRGVIPSKQKYIR